MACSKNADWWSGGLFIVGSNPLQLKLVHVSSILLFKINEYHNKKSGLCMYNVIGWDVMSGAYSMAFY